MDQHPHVGKGTTQFGCRISLASARVARDPILINPPASPLPLYPAADMGKTDELAWLPVRPVMLILLFPRS